MVGESALVNPVFDALNSYFVQIPVLAGDRIGLYWDKDNTSGADCRRIATDFDYHYHTGDVVPPTRTKFTFGSDYQYDVSALLEGDCDKDGLGDETQDGNLSACGPAAVAAQAQLSCQGQQPTIVGTNNADLILGTQGRDVISALGGRDTVFALDGNDVVCGNSGKDRLRGQVGDDSIKGNDGADSVKGGRGDDNLKGGRGGDLLKGNRGDDRLVGGRDNDACRPGKGSDTLLRSC
jgi:Ca2+-binding RTX toxin-like protein